MKSKNEFISKVEQIVEACEVASADFLVRAQDAESEDEKTELKASARKFATKAKWFMRLNSESVASAFYRVSEDALEEISNDSYASAKVAAIASALTSKSKEALACEDVTEKMITEIALKDFSGSYHPRDFKIPTKRNPAQFHTGRQQQMTLKALARLGAAEEVQEGNRKLFKLLPDSPLMTSLAELYA